MKQFDNETRPARLMAGTHARAIVAMEVLVEQDQVTPVRIVLVRRVHAVDGPQASSVFQEDPRKPA